jgi:polysaccharide export outer membrane protein
VYGNLRGFSGDYQVGPGDLLEIQVVTQADLNQNLRISNAGEISFPRLGLVRVVDMTPFEIEEAIAVRLREQGLLQQAEVLVTVREYQAKPIYVSGSVVNPGQFVMSQELTVADAILLAGGLVATAGNEAVLHRRPTPPPGERRAVAAPGPPEPGEPGLQTIKINLKPLKEGRFFEAALPLKRGDVIVVPQQQMNPYFVIGEVIDPKNYFYQPGRKFTASQAISSAKGPTPTAKLSEGMLIRYDQSGRREERKVDYAAILKGDQADFLVEPNDVIFIPGSRIKTITHALLIMSDTMVMQQSFRVGRNIQRPDQPTIEDEIGR